MIGPRRRSARSNNRAAAGRTRQKNDIVNKKFVAPLLLVGLATFGGVACSSDEKSSDTTTAEAAQLIAPVFVDITEIDGTSVEVRQDRALVLNADEPAAWTATIADPSVLSFVAGRLEGTAEFNPGFTPLAIGSTEVTMTDGTTTVTFTVTVVGIVG